MNLTELTDQELVERCLQGDKTTFGILVDRYKDKVFNTIFRMMGNREDAEDLLQEVLLRAYRGLEKFKAQSTFSTWIYRITVNHCMTQIRRSKTVKHQKLLSLDLSFRKGEGEESVVFESKRDLDPVENLQRAEQEVLIQQAVSELPEEYRLILVLKDIEGVGYEEIAEIVECPLGTVRSRLFKARETLRRKLKDII